MRWWHLLLCAMSVHPHLVVFLGGSRFTPTGYGLVCPWCGDVKE